MTKSDAKEIRLIVASDEIATLFSSVAAAETYLEAIDVENGEYPVAYGVDGRVYRVSQQRLSAWDSGSVLIAETDQSAPEELAALLRRLAASSRIGVNPDQPVEDLLSELSRFLIA